MDCELLACDGESDHLYSVIEYPPKISVWVLVNSLKVTSVTVHTPGGLTVIGLPPRCP